MIRLEAGVFTWGCFNPEKQYNFNGFLVSFPGGTLVVDPPPLSEDDTAYLDKLGLWPDMIVITNRNHLRDREHFLSRKPVPTAMHEEEAGQVDIPVERRLKDGDSLPGGLSVVHLPGKSPGEIGLYWRSRRLLMLGDALIAPFGSLRLIPEAKLDDPVGLRRSLGRLEALDFDRLLLADGDPLLADAKAKVRAFLATLAPTGTPA